MIDLTFAVAALCAGGAQAWLLRRDAGRSPRPFGFLLRFALACAILVTAALSGRLLAAALGWFVGFSLSALWLLRRWA